MIRKCFILSLALLMTFHVLEFHDRIKLTSLAEDRVQGQDMPQATEWELNMESGVSFWIGLNWRAREHPTRLRHIFVFLESHDFNVDNLKRVFQYLSETYIQPELLVITVRSDMSVLQQWIDCYKAFYSLRPDSFMEISAFQAGVDDLHNKTWRGSYRAEYDRNANVEVFNYSPDAYKEDMAHVVLRQDIVFAPSGDLSCDLVRASRRGLVEEVNNLLHAGADVNAMDKYGNMPLVAAALAGQANVVNTLLERGADINQRDSDGWSALMCAIMLGYDEVAQELLKRGANVNARSETGQTALMLAARRSSAEIIQDLLRRGADINVTDRYGRTPLMIAEEHEWGRVDVVNLLRKAMTSK